MVGEGWGGGGAVAGGRAVASVPGRVGIRHRECSKVVNFRAAGGESRGSERKRRQENVKSKARVQHPRECACL